MGDGNTSIAVDGNDCPHIAFTGVSDLLYASWNGSDWIVSTIEPACNSFSVSLLFDDSDNPRVAYTTIYDNNLRLASWDGEQWNIEVVDSGYSTRCNTIGFKLDSFGNPCIAFRRGGDLYYGDYSGSEWSFDLVNDSCCTALSSISLALNTDDEPHIAYLDVIQSSSPSAMYARCNSGVWSVELVATEVCDVSLALNDEGLARIPLGLSLKGVIFAWEYEEGIEDLNPGFPLLCTSAWPNPASTVLNLRVQLDAPSDVAVDIFDLYGRRAANSTEFSLFGGVNEIQLNLEELSAGLYLFSVSTPGCESTGIFSLIR